MPQQALVSDPSGWNVRYEPVVPTPTGLTTADGKPVVKAGY